MNIKSLRRDYQNLTMLERLSLADNAIARDDENEERAINAASPKQLFRQVDFYDLLREITTFRLCNLISRLSYIMQFDYFTIEAELEILKEKPNLKLIERLTTNQRMTAFLFVRATDSWRAVNDELGLRPNFDEEISEFLFSIEMMKEKEEMMRALAFSETEASELLKNRFGDGTIQTLDDEIKAIKEALGLGNKK
jgi:hypothetical protein